MSGSGEIYGITLATLHDNGACSVKVWKFRGNANHALDAVKSQLADPHSTFDIPADQVAKMGEITTDRVNALKERGEPKRLGSLSQPMAATTPQESER